MSPSSKSPTAVVNAEFYDPRRRQLIEKINKRAREWSIGHLLKILWPFLWLADIENLEYMVEQDVSPLNPKSCWYGLTNVQIEHACENDQVAQAAVADECVKRDKRECVVTHDPAVQVIHIFPLNLRKCLQLDDKVIEHRIRKQDGLSEPSDDESHVVDNDELKEFRTEFRMMLRRFWTEQRVKRWFQNLDACETCLDTVHNMISLSPTAVYDHAHHLFALRPRRLSKDKTKLDLTFYWLSQPEDLSQIKDADFDACRVPSLTVHRKNHAFVRGKKYMLFNNEKGREMHSGDTVTLTTNDPESKPLPDMGLLDMQWILQRVWALNDSIHEPDWLLGQRDDSIPSDESLPRAPYTQSSQLNWMLAAPGLRTRAMTSARPAAYATIDDVHATTYGGI
ncbi:hypothetical protein KEM56_006430 [Ascosphaera pollenicola]|nr:hypothetical protein KEM56_006430 [Ascosphaera pollenicola]